MPLAVKKEMQLEKAGDARTIVEPLAESEEQVKAGLNTRVRFNDSNIKLFNFNMSRFDFHGLFLSGLGSRYGSCLADCYYVSFLNPMR